MPSLLLTASIELSALNRMTAQQVAVLAGRGVPAADAPVTIGGREEVTAEGQVEEEATSGGELTPQRAARHVP